MAEVLSDRLSTGASQSSEAPPIRDPATTNAQSGQMANPADSLHPRTVLDCEPAAAALPYSDSEAYQQRSPAHANDPLPLSNAPEALAWEGGQGPGRAPSSNPSEVRQTDDGTPTEGELEPLPDHPSEPQPDLCSGTDGARVKDCTDGTASVCPDDLKPSAVPPSSDTSPPVAAVAATQLRPSPAISSQQPAQHAGFSTVEPTSGAVTPTVPGSMPQSLESPAVTPGQPPSQPDFSSAGLPEGFATPSGSEAVISDLRDDSETVLRPSPPHSATPVGLESPLEPGQPADTETQTDSCDGVTGLAAVGEPASDAPPEIAAAGHATALEANRKLQHQLCRALAVQKQTSNPAGAFRVEA